MSTTARNVKHPEVQFQQPLLGQMKVCWPGVLLQQMVGFFDLGLHFVAAEVKQHHRPAFPAFQGDAFRFGLQCHQQAVTGFEAVVHFSKGQGGVITGEKLQHMLQVLPNPEEFQHTFSLLGVPDIILTCLTQCVSDGIQSRGVRYAHQRCTGVGPRR